MKICEIVKSNSIFQSGDNFYIHSRTFYKYFDIAWDAKFSPIFEYKNGRTIVPIDQIGKFEYVKNK